MILFFFGVYHCNQSFDDLFTSFFAKNENITGFLTAVLVASFAFAGFQNENTRFMTVFVETVRLAKSRPIKNQ